DLWMLTLSGRTSYPSSRAVSMAAARSWSSPSSGDTCWSGGRLMTCSPTWMVTIQFFFLTSQPISALPACIMGGLLSPGVLGRTAKSAASITRSMLQMAGEDLQHEDNFYYGSGEH